MQEKMNLKKVLLATVAATATHVAILMLASWVVAKAFLAPFTPVLTLMVIFGLVYQLARKAGTEVMKFVIDSHENCDESCEDECHDFDDDEEAEVVVNTNTDEDSE
jgi:uncharacterized protein YacL